MAIGSGSGWLAHSLPADDSRPFPDGFAFGASAEVAGRLTRELQSLPIDESLRDERSSADYAEVAVPLARPEFLPPAFPGEEGTEPSAASPSATALAGQAAEGFAWSGRFVEVPSGTPPLEAIAAGPRQRSPAPPGPAANASQPGLQRPSKSRPSEGIQEPLVEAPRVEPQGPDGEPAGFARPAGLPRQASESSAEGAAPSASLQPRDDSAEGAEPRRPRHFIREPVD
jgi:hypothetical protein